MKSILRFAATVITVLLSHTTLCADEQKERLTELDAFWAEVSRSVKEGDFAAYAATCHPEAVLVAGGKKMSQPLSVALARWKKEFDDTKSGERESNVSFRFSERLGDATTAHETGIFLYSFKQGGGETKHEYVHLEALMVKRDGKWLILMEYQKASATEEEWKALE